jgi:SAM-dependent methyltransferase
VGSHADGRYSYTDGNAELYGLLGIEGTTYRIGFDAVAKLLGDVSGKTFLDFGCGTGRSARFLRGRRSLAERRNDSVYRDHSWRPVRHRGHLLDRR